MLAFMMLGLKKEHLNFKLNVMRKKAMVPFGIIKAKEQNKKRRQLMH